MELRNDRVARIAVFMLRADLIDLITFDEVDFLSLSSLSFCSHLSTQLVERLNFVSKPVADMVFSPGPKSSHTTL